MAFNKLPLAEKLTSKAKRLDSGCLIFEGDKYPNGYGRLRLKGKHYRAHRLMYEIHHGAIPNGSVIRHRCDNPACIAIEHLEVGTQLDNVHDAWERGRARALSGESNGRAKLTEAQVRDIRTRYIPHSRQAGAAALSRLFNVSASAVRDILDGSAWRHL